MRKTSTRILWWGCVTFLVLTTQVITFAQQTQKKISPDSQSGKVVTMQEMVAGMNNGTTYNVKKILQANNPRVKFTKREDNPLLRLQYDIDRLKNPWTGEIPADIREKELTYILSSESHLQEESVAPARIRNARAADVAFGDAITPFTSRGPFNVAGRTRALAIDISDENRLLAGGASGGIWLSTDQGTSWQRVSPLDQNPSITAIVQDTRPGYRNIWYAGTGETIGASQGGRSGSARYLGNGIYKSIDNGSTWELMRATVSNTPQNLSSQEPFELIADMAIDPGNGDLYVATYLGILRSSGGSFQYVLPVVDFRFLSQLDIHITASRVFYASIPRNAITAAGPGNAGIYRSTTGNLNEWVSITPSGFPSSYGRVTLTTAPSNDNILYVLASETSSVPVGHDFWKYTYLSGYGNGAGGTWENRSANLPAFGGNAGSFLTYGGYAQYVRVHPANPDLVFVGGVNLYRSTDGFATTNNTAWIGGYSIANDFSHYPKHHPDQHSMEFFPSNPNKVITGHDGGLSLTDDITATAPDFAVTWRSLNNGYLTTQVYALAIGPGNLIMAGFQDNNTWSTVSAREDATWVNQFSGDGCATAINKTGTIRYVSSQGGIVYRTRYDNENDNTPNSYAEISPSKSGLFVTKFELDPNDDKIMYYVGYNTVWRANNVTAATATTGWNNLNNTSNTEQVSALGISKLPANVVYVGTVKGRIYRIDKANNGNPAWVDVYTGKGLPPGNVSCIAVDPTNSNRAIVTFSNYEIKSIWLTENGGNTWSDVSGNLEQDPGGGGNGPSVRWLNIVGKNNAYLAATSTGLYSTKVLNGTATTWTQVDPTVLGVAIVEQVRSTKNGLVVVGTHGNGLFSTQFKVEETMIEISIESVKLKNFTEQNSESEVSIEITNYGLIPQTNFDVAYQVAGGSVIKETYTDTIKFGETKSFTFANRFRRSVLGPFTVLVTVQIADENPNNNNATGTSVVLPTATLPYENNFETTNGGWTAGGTANSWAWGTPAATFINAASSGTKVWATNLTGKYSTNESSYVVSPFFPINSDFNEIKVSLDIRYSIEANYDGAALQFSTDGGTTWSNVGTINDPTASNWYTVNLKDVTQSAVLDFTDGNGDAWSGETLVTGYNTASNIISGLSGKSSLLLRVVFGSDEYENLEGIAFDNVVIGTKQTINFSSLAPKTYGDAPFMLTATGGCGPVTYTSSNMDVATITGNTLTIVGAGIAVITANQDGDQTCFASTAQQTLTVNKAQQTITFDNLPAKTYGDAPFTLSATGGQSGEAVIFESVDDKVAISGTTATLMKAGRATIKATQAGNERYDAAISIERSFCIKPAKPAIISSDPPTDSPTLTSSATVGNQWYKDGIAITGATGTTFEVTETGSYTVVSTVDGCVSEASAAAVIVITGEPKPLGNTELAVYPNPVDDELIVQLGGFTKNNLTLTIVDLTGRKLLQKEAKGGDDVHIKVGQLAAGNYLVRIVQKDKWAQIKFIKR